MNKDDTRFASRKDYEDLHEKVDDIAIGMARMEGKIDGMAKQKGSDYTFFGMIIAIVLGLWNTIK